MLYDREQPAAGPSSRPYSPPPPVPPASPSCPLGVQCPFRPLRANATSSPRHEVLGGSRAAPPPAAWKRQEGTSTTEVSSSPLFVPPPSSLTTPEGQASQTSEYPEPVAASPQPSAASGSSSSPSMAPSPTSSSYTSTFDTTRETPAPLTSSFSRPWEPSTRSTASHPSESTPYVPGVILPLSLGGDSDDQAVYSVQMSFGHGTLTTESSRRRKRRPSKAWDGGTPQTVNLLVDLGSSDIWVASVNCTTSDCDSAPALFNETQSLDTQFNMEFEYHNGQVSGGIYWEQINLGGFSIGYQAFMSADEVTDEDLGGGNFTGLLGLGLPANSVIQSKVAGSTSGNPDGATFLDNLFGAGYSAPTERLFSLALERREDVRTRSLLGIGAVSKDFCPSPCNLNYMPIIPQPSLGITGYLHWRLPLLGITTTKFSDAQNGQGASSQKITLGPSRTDTSRGTPLAVLDSGGLQILVGDQNYLNSIYGAFGVSPSSDGQYRMSCTTQIALSFNFGGREYPVHPLDMTWPDPEDPSQTTCIGALQYSSSLGNSGDFILGSSFMKNVYSIFQYPDNVARITWQPTIGLISLTNASVASQDFYAVRNLRQSLGSVSADHTGSGSGTGVGINPSASAGAGNAPADTPGRVLSTAGIAGISVVAFFVFAAGIFCAWWFWLRRRFGANGKVEYNETELRRRSSGGRSDHSALGLRNKKHSAALRQKSMIEGYSDYEDSWMSTTEGNDSIRLGYIPEVVEEDEQRKTNLGEGSSRTSSLRDSSVPCVETGQLVDTAPPETEIVQPAVMPAPIKSRRRDASPAATRALSLGTDDLDSPRFPSAYGYPAISGSPSARTLSLSMSGPFPSASPNRQSMRPDTSPMYDIRSSDYFNVNPGSHGRDTRRFSGVSNMDRPEMRGSSPRRPSGVAGTPVFEEPEVIER